MPKKVDEIEREYYRHEIKGHHKNVNVLARYKSQYKTQGQKPHQDNGDSYGPLLSFACNFQMHLEFIKLDKEGI